MSALDKLQMYSAKKENTLVSPVAEYFDIKSPEGYFLNTIHNLGYRIVETTYTQGDKVLTKSEYDALEDKAGVEVSTQLTELAKMLTTKGDMLANSTAGSGKTTALIFRIMRDIATGEATKKVTLPDGTTVSTLDSIFVGTFLKTGADELKQKLASWQRNLKYFVTADRIQFGTLHAEFKRALNALGAPTPIGSVDAISRCLKRAIDDLSIKRDGSYALTFEDYRTIESIVSFYRNRLDNDKYNHPSARDYGLTPLILDSLVTKFANERKSEGIMDFEDLQELLYKYLYVTPNPDIQNFIASRYKYMYLDEFQDTSQIQYAILKFYMRGRLAINRSGEAMPVGMETGLYTGEETSGKIIAVGDDDQSVYRWRGSDIDIIIKNFPEDFKPQIVQLSTNYRCPSNILNPIKTSIVKNTDRFPKNLRSSREGGEFHAYTALTVQVMIEHLLQQIEEDTLNGKSVAILCRTNFDGVIPALMLEMSGKYQFSVSSEAMTLSSAMPKTVINCARLFTDRTSQYVINTLKLFVDRSDQWSVQELVKRLKADASMGMGRSVFDIAPEDLAYSSPKLATLIKTLKTYLYDSNGNAIKGGDIEALKVLYLKLLIDVYDGDSAYCSKIRAYIQAVLYVLKVRKFTSADDFLSTMSDWNDCLNARVGKAYKVKIATVHEFKGKEADCCYIWHDSKDLFPASKTNTTIKVDFEEERRVHYIACTRAREKSIVYALAKNAGEFFFELDCTPEAIRPVNKGKLSGVSQEAEFTNTDPLDVLIENYRQKETEKEAETMS